MYKQRICLSRPIIQEETKILANLLKTDKFNDSNRWLEKFCHRNNTALRRE